MIGDSQIGKTSLMVKYAEGAFDEDYIQTLGEFLRPIARHAAKDGLILTYFDAAGVNFMEKSVSLLIGPSSSSAPEPVALCVLIITLYHALIASGA